MQDKKPHANGICFEVTSAHSAVIEMQQPAHKELKWAKCVVEVLRRLASILFSTHHARSNTNQLTRSMFAIAYKAETLD